MDGQSSVEDGGNLVVTSLKVEDVGIVHRIRTPHICVAFRLLPMGDEIITPASQDKVYEWKSSFALACRETALRDATLQIRIFDDVRFQHRTCVAELLLPLQRLLDETDMAWADWFEAKHVGKFKKEGRKPCRVYMSLAYHVTTSSEIETSAYGVNSADESLSSPNKTKSMLKIPSSPVLFLTRNMKNNSPTPKSSTMATRMPKGTLEFSVRSLHLCDSLCSTETGHRSSSIPDFKPLFILKFEDNKHEARIGKTECDKITFDRAWPVYSSHSSVKLDIFQKTSMGKELDRKTGRRTNHIGSLDLSLFQILERDALQHTLTPPPIVHGPDQKPPLPGYEWHHIRQGNKTIGLVMICARYEEDYRSLLDGEVGPDTLYTNRSMKNFDIGMIQRDLERLDKYLDKLRDAQQLIQDVHEWKNPAQTIAVWGGVHCSICYLPLDIIPFAAAVGITGAIVANYGRFVLGLTRRSWIYRPPPRATPTKKKPFRPFATLRLLSVTGENLMTEDEDGGGEVYVQILYKPSSTSIEPKLLTQTSPLTVQSGEKSEFNLNHEGTGAKMTWKAFDKSWMRMAALYLSTFEEANCSTKKGKWQLNGSKQHYVDCKILQPATMKPNNMKTNFIPWSESGGEIQLIVIRHVDHDECRVLGTVEVPLKKLLSDEQKGGVQHEWHDKLSLDGPPEVHDSSTTTVKRYSSGALTVRMQLILRKSHSPVTLQEAVESEGLIRDWEQGPSRKQESFYQKLTKARSAALAAQQALSFTLLTIERMRNLISWAHPKKTLLALGFMLFFSIFLYYVPFRYVIAYYVAKWFVRRLHQHIDVDFVRFANFLSSIPSDMDMRKIYYWDNLEYLRTGHPKTESDWAGPLWKQDVVSRMWQERYGVLRNGKLELWENAESSASKAAPKSTLFLANVVEKCSRKETRKLSCNVFPLVVFNTAYETSSTFGVNRRRRLICTTNEADFQLLVDAIQQTGEALLSD